MKNVLKLLAITLTAIIMALTLCACTNNNSVNETAQISPDTTGKPVSGGELTVGIPQDLDDSLDPHKMEAAGTREILFNIFEGLVKPDSEGNLIPAVASAYDINETGDIYTFSLREGVLFHNGEAVSAEDVVYSITRCMGENGGEPLIPAFSVVKSVEATSDKTVVVTLNAPDTEFLAYFSAAIIPKGYEDQETAPVGTGPYKFVSRAALENIILEKFDSYWAEPAYIDRVVCKIISNPETLVMSLNSGALDMVSHLTSAQIAGISNDFNILEGSMNLVQALYLNNAVKPLDNIDVRRALSQAINREEIMQFLADGRGKATGSSMYPALVKYFVPELSDYYKYDPAEAKRLLAEAGYPNGFDLEITVPSNYSPHMITAEVIAEQLKAIGVSATIRPVEFSTWLTETYMGREFQSTVIGFDAKTITARAMLERWSSTAADNMINFSDEEYDRTLAEAMSTTDEAKQTELYKRCLEILTERAANVYIQDLCDLVALRSTIEGYEFYPLYAIDLAKLHYVA